MALQCTNWRGQADAGAVSVDSHAPWLGSSLRAGITDSTAIGDIVATSVVARTETVTGSGQASSYRPLQELRFTTHEYLKGSGPGEVVVIVEGGKTYATGERAREEADYALSQRNTQWDERQGVLYLLDNSVTPRTYSFLLPNDLDD